MDSSVWTSPSITTTSSGAAPAAAWAATPSFSQRVNFTSATPSRRMALRKPRISAAFFTAFSAGMGDGAETMLHLTFLYKV